MMKIFDCCLSGSRPFQCFGPSLQEISQKFQNLSTVGQKAAVKVYHAKKTLQLFDILRGWAIFYFGSVISRAGRSCRQNRVLSMYANTPSRPSVVPSIILWKVCAALDSPTGVNKYLNGPNGVMIAVFGMSSVATGNW
jgi:hypothetical protein